MQAKTILVVDDDPLNIQVINEILLEKKTNEYEVLNANNGQLAFRIAQSIVPDIILSDWEMPQMNGIELTKALKADVTTAEIPVIIASGVMLTSKDLDIALAAGAVDYIRKPIDRIELVARVRSVLEMADYIRQIKVKTDIIAEQEKEILKQNILQLQHELEHKQRELSSNFSFLIQIENEKEKYLQDLNKLNPYLNSEGKRQLVTTKQQIQQNNNSKSLLELENKFDAINHKFYEALEKACADITKTEKMLLAYMRMNLSPAEIATITQKSLNTINVSFSRIRTKLNMESNTVLKTFVLEL